MNETRFVVEIDGRRVLVDQAKQEVSILDGDGAVIFRDRIQVAAGSLQGLFSALQDATTLGLGTGPTQNA